MRNLYVHDNVVTMSSGSSGLGVNGSDAYYTKKNNRFARNTYHLRGAGRPFWWQGKARTAAEWKGFGQDVTGRFNQ